LRKEHAVEEFAILQFDTKGAVAGFHRGIGGEDGAQERFGAHGTGAVQDGADLAAFARDGVANLTGGGKDGLAARWVAGGIGQGAKTVEQGGLSARLGGGEEEREITAQQNAGTGSKGGPLLAGEMVSDPGGKILGI